MKVRAIRPFRWAGEPVEPGTLLDVDARTAHLLVHGYGDCAYVDEVVVPQSTMVVNADPIVQSRDPAAGVAAKRRRP